MEEKEPIINNPETELGKPEREAVFEKGKEGEVDRKEPLRPFSQPEKEPISEELEREKEEKRNAYKNEIDHLVRLAEEKGFDEALKEAKKISKKKRSAMIVDLFHDRLAEKSND